MKIGKLDKASEPFSVRAKPFWDLTCTQSVIMLLLLFIKHFFINYNVFLLNRSLILCFKHQLLF